MPVLLAGGNPKRMRPLNEGYHKFMLKISGNPIFFYPLSSLLQAAGQRVILVVDREMQIDWVKEFLREKNYAHVEVRVQPGESLEDAFLTATKDVSDEWFLLVFGDVVAPPEALRMLMETYEESQRPSALVIPRAEMSTYGVAYLSGMSIKKVYPGGDVGDSSFVLGGAFVLPVQFLELVENGSGFFEALNTVVDKMGMDAALWTGSWVAVDYPWDLISALYEILGSSCKSVIHPGARVSPLAVLEGCVIVEEGAYIDHYAVVRGPAYIGRNVLVGKGAFVREYTSLEEGSTVGAFSEVKRSVLEPSATAGSYSLIVDSVLGPYSVAEPRTTVISEIRGEKRIARPLPLQGVLSKKRKLGVFVAPRGRIAAGSVVGPGVLIHGDGRVEEV